MIWQGINVNSPRDHINLCTHPQKNCKCVWVDFWWVIIICVLIYYYMKCDKVGVWDEFVLSSKKLSNQRLCKPSSPVLKTSYVHVYITAFFLLHTNTRWRSRPKSSNNRASKFYYKLGVEFSTANIWWLQAWLHQPSSWCWGHSQHVQQRHKEDSVPLASTALYCPVLSWFSCNTYN